MPHITDAISITEARANLKKVIDSVIDDHAPVAITRRGAGAVVVVSLEDYNALQETIHVHSQPGLAEYMKDIDAGKVTGGVTVPEGVLQNFDSLEDLFRWIDREHAPDAKSA
ncbi:MAG: type II toxin-antitoxin system Phd/YefM family antitoxin [Glycocaulis sp.]